MSAQLDTSVPGVAATAAADVKTGKEATQLSYSLLAAQSQAIVNPTLDVLNYAIGQLGPDQKTQNKLEAIRDEIIAQESTRKATAVQAKNKAGFAKIYSDISSEVKEIAEKERESLRDIFSNVGAEYAFYSLVRSAQTEILEGKHRVMARVLDFFAREHQAEYLGALKKARELVTQYSEAGETRFGVFSGVLLAQRNNFPADAASVDMWVYLEQMTYFAAACYKMANLNAVQLKSGNIGATEDYIRRTVAQYKAIHMDKIPANERDAALKLSDEEFYIKVNGKFPLSILHRDAIKVLPTILDCLVDYLDAIYQKDSRSSLDIVTEFVRRNVPALSYRDPFYDATIQNLIPQLIKVWETKRPEAQRRKLDKKEGAETQAQAFAAAATAATAAAGSVTVSTASASEGAAVAGTAAAPPILPMASAAAANAPALTIAVADSATATIPTAEAIAVAAHDAAAAASPRKGIAADAEF